jgi:hypothetical protein
MHTCGHLVSCKSEFKYNDIDYVNKKTKNDNIEQVLSFTISTEKNEYVNDDEKFIFIPNKILNIINPSENKFTWGYYAFMLTREADDGKEKKNDAIIGLSQNPILSAYTHNINKSYKESNNNNMNWELSIIIGPFQIKSEGELCCNDWQDETRGIVSKTIRSGVLQKKFNKPIYKKGPVDKQVLDNTLNELPFVFRDTLNNKDVTISSTVDNERDETDFFPTTKKK